MSQERYASGSSTHSGVGSSLESTPGSSARNYDASSNELVAPKKFQARKPIVHIGAMENLPGC